MTNDLKTLKDIGSASRQDINEGLSVICIDDLREEAKKWIKHYEQMHEKARTTGNSDLALSTIMMRKSFIKFFNLED